MQNIYTATYWCKSVIPLVETFCDVVLGLSLDSKGATDIIVKGTCARFVVGKEYVITIAETE